MATTERFIVSTGRAGSTLLSRMLSENRGTLVLSEFLGGVDNLDRFPTEPVTGERLASILARWDNMGALQRLRAFPADPGWEKRAAAMLDSSLGQRPHNLSPEEYERVHAAALPGQILLGREDPAQLNTAYRVMRDAFDKYDPE